MGSAAKNLPEGAVMRKPRTLNPVIHRGYPAVSPKLASEISHPTIVSVVDFGEDPAYGAYMVMDLVERVPPAAGRSMRGGILGGGVAQVPQALEQRAAPGL